MRRSVLTLVIVVGLVWSGRASAQEAETKKPAETPRILEWLNLEFGMAPASVSLWFGMHTWLKNKYLVGVRGGARQSITLRDLDGDGTDDWGKSIGNNPLHFELQADFGVPIMAERGWRTYGTGLRKLVKQPDGSSRIIYEGGFSVPDVTELSIATGARVGIGGDEFQVALPLGLRYSYRVLTRGVQFREWWISLRALMFVPSFRPGLDAEFAYMLGPFGFSVFFEWFPQIRDDDASKVVCRLSPMQQCTPSVPLTVFNRVPNEGMILGGLRLRMTKSL